MKQRQRYIHVISTWLYRQSEKLAYVARELGMSEDDIVRLRNWQAQNGMTCAYLASISADTALEHIDASYPEDFNELAELLD